MSEIVIRVARQGGGWVADATAHRFATSPELAARLAAAAALGCEVTEVEVVGQSRDLFLAHKRLAVAPSRPLLTEVQKRFGEGITPCMHRELEKYLAEERGGQ